VNGRIVAAGPPTEVLDGVESTEDFDRRSSSPTSPGRPARGCGSRRRRSDHRPAQLQLPVDSQMVWIALAAVVLHRGAVHHVKLLYGRLAFAVLAAPNRMLVRWAPSRPRRPPGHQSVENAMTVLLALERAAGR